MKRDWTLWIALLVLFGGLATVTRAQDENEEVAPSRSHETTLLPEFVVPADTEPVVVDQLRELHHFAGEILSDSARSDADRAEAVGELGRHYHAYGFSREATDCYELAGTLAPRDFRWTYLLGYLAQGEGRLEEARGRYEKALSIVPGVSPTLIRLAAVYAELGNADKAEWLYREALRTDPASSAAEAGLGELLLGQNRAEEAAVLLQGALEKTPEANRLFYPLALAYRKLGEDERARQLLAWRGDVGIKPADPVIDSLEGLKTGERVHLLQGQSAFWVGRYAEAANQFRKALDINPDSIGGWIDLGSALGEMGNVDEAIGAFERAVELAPGNETALFNLGVLLSRRGEHDRAINYLSQAGQFAPSDGQIRYELAQALRLAERWEDAIVHFDAAIQAFPGQEAPWLGKAQALVRMQRLAEARTTLEAALDQHPESATLALALSRILALADDPKVRDAQRAVGLALKVFEARRELADAEWVAEVLAEADRCEQAAEWLRKVLDEATQAGQPAQVVDRLQSSLARFEGGVPCRLASPGP